MSKVLGDKEEKLNQNMQSHLLWAVQQKIPECVLKLGRPKRLALPTWGGLLLTGIIHPCSVAVWGKLSAGSKPQAKEQPTQIHTALETVLLQFCHTYKNRHKLDAVGHTCHPSYSGGEGRRIASSWLLGLLCEKKRAGNAAHW